MIEDMYAVMTRINEIKKRFGVGRNAKDAVQDKNFQVELEKRIGDASGKDPVPGTGTINTGNRSGRVSAPKNLSRSEILDIARDQALRKGVPEKLVSAVIQAESSYNPNAVSKKGAKGLMQLMPDVVSSMGVADPFSPEENIRAGVGVLKNLLEKYNWDYKKALAAYNAGERAVDEYGGVPPYGETMEYVNKVINYYLKNSE